MENAGWSVGHSPKLTGGRGQSAGAQVENSLGSVLDRPNQFGLQLRHDKPEAPRMGRVSRNASNAVSCVDVYGPRLIAEVCLVLVSRSRLLMYIRLLKAA
jgi:hypothetical protein